MAVQKRRNQKTHQHSYLQTGLPILVVVVVFVVVAVVFGVVAVAVGMVVFLVFVLMLSGMITHPRKRNWSKGKRGRGRERERERGDQIQGKHSKNFLLFLLLVITQR